MLSTLSTPHVERTMRSLWRALFAVSDPCLRRTVAAEYAAFYDEWNRRHLTQH